MSIIQVFWGLYEVLLEITNLESCSQVGEEVKIDNPEPGLNGPMDFSTLVPRGFCEYR
jgi:hypothetical protein